jgi:hypothetical protein
MRPLFGGDSKKVAIGNAFANVLPGYEGKFDAALMNYGNSVSGPESCQASTLLEPFAPLAAPELTNALAALKTKGEVPIARTLKAAADELTRSAHDMPKGLVLIAGGPETCKGDPCATAHAISALFKAPIEVIAIDAGGEEAQLRGLRCIATDPSKGFWRVSSTMELTAALDDAIAAALSEANASASNDTTTGTSALMSPTGTTGDQATTQQQSSPPLRGSAPLGKLNLEALLTEAGPILGEGVIWRVYQPAGNKAAPAKLLATSKEASPTLALPSGDYMVAASYGLSYITRRVKFSGTEANEQFILNAGGLKLDAKLADGTAPSPDSVSCEIYSDERDQSGNRARIASGLRPGATLRLNSGIYYLVAIYGDANAILQTDFSVEAGRITEATLNLAGSKVSFRLVQQKGGEALAGTSWTIQTSNGELVKQSLGALPSHILAAGNYTVTAERAGKKFSQDFTVQPSHPMLVEVLETSE